MIPAVLSLTLTLAGVLDPRPGIGDAQGLPTLPYLTELRLSNHVYEEHLLNCIQQWPERPVLRLALRETRTLGEWFRLAQIARQEWRDADERRDALQQLRQLAGAEAYYSGQVPPCVPCWRFPR